MRSDPGASRVPGSSVVLVAVLCLIAPAPSFAWTIIEKTLAFVNKKPILLSDVELTRALMGIDAPQALERTIEESLMFEDAIRLVNEPPGEAALEGAIATLQARAGSPSSRAAFLRKARVQLAISNYIDVRLRALVRVEDVEVRRVFNEMVATQNPATVFDAVSHEIRAALERKCLDQKIEEWVKALRARAEIRRVP